MSASEASNVAQAASGSIEESESHHVQQHDNLKRDQAGQGQDEVMTDDMKLAVSALGLLRQEGGAGGETVSSSAPHHSTSASSAAPLAGPSSHTASQQYRSTSTASTSTTSDAWGTSSASTFLPSGSEIGTATSSPLTTTSMATTEAEGGDYFKRGTVDGEPEDEVEEDPKFIERVSQLPIVSGGLEWYERSKANSRVVKYGAGLVESSFSAVSKPITNNLQLGPLDDFACRQLDRMGAPNRSPIRKDGEHLEEHDRREKIPPSQQQRSDEEYEGSPAGQIAVQHGQRSRWQTVLVEAGGLGAAVSEESLKSLRYCLQWLVYATAHLDHQTSALRDFILSLRAHNRAHPLSSSSASARESTALVAASASAHLSQIKHDVVETIRKVVEVVSKYAGAALPEQAKRYVKQSIMGLPVKWASAIESRGNASRGGTGGANSTRMDRQGSENDTPGVDRMGDAHYNDSGRGDARTREERERDEAEAEARAALGPTEEAADRVLTFAVESLDMLRSVASIFGESVEKAEAWIERLRIVGLQRQRQRQEQEQQQGQNFAIEPPPSNSASSSSMHWNDSTSTSGGMKRRRGATRGRHGSVADGFDGENEGQENGEGEGGMTDGEEMIASARRKRGARSREMSAQLS